jgi:hypothetical protein
VKLQKDCCPGEECLGWPKALLERPRPGLPALVRQELPVAELLQQGQPERPRLELRHQEFHLRLLTAHLAQQLQVLKFRLRQRRPS